VDATMARSGRGIGVTSCVANFLLLMLESLELVAEAWFGE
jgi:hypothetical protein